MPKTTANLRDKDPVDAVYENLASDIATVAREVISGLRC